MKSHEKTYKLAMFLAHKIAQSQTAQPGDLAKVLTDAKIFDWNDVSSRINPMLDKIEFQGKFNSELLVDPAGNVVVQVSGGNPKAPQVQKELQAMFAPKMSNILKTKNMKPGQTVVVPWLAGVG